MCDYFTNAEVRARQQQEHRDKYEALSVWLGLDGLKALVPFGAERIRAALAAGDEYLNTLGLFAWDRQHNSVWRLLRGAIKRDREEGRTPLVNAWSLSDTVCVLKHVARYRLTGAR